MLKRMLICVVVFIIVALVLACLFRSVKRILGGSYVMMYGNKKILDIYEHKDEYSEDVFDKLKEYDEKVFRCQIDKVNTFTNSKDLTAKTFIVPDVHGSLIETFAPLIRANIIKAGSIGFNGVDFVYELHEQTKSNNGGKVIYCGDFIARGSNRYNVQLLNCILTLTETCPNSVKLVLGNHEMWFMFENNPDVGRCVWNDYVWNDYVGASSPDYIKNVRNKVIRYFLNNPNALAYIDADGFAVTHTIIYKCREYMSQKGPISSIMSMENVDRFYDQSSGTLFIDDAHEWLCNELQKAVSVDTVEAWKHFKDMANVFYSNSRPQKTKEAGTWKINLITDVVNLATSRGDEVVRTWFVGHHPVQEVDEPNRVLTTSNGLKIHFMDVNTYNNFPSSIAYMDPDGLPELNWGTELLYYHDFNSNRNVSEYIHNDDIRGVINECFEYIDRL